MENSTNNSKKKVSSIDNDKECVMHSKEITQKSSLLKKRIKL